MNIFGSYLEALKIIERIRTQHTTNIMADNGIFLPSDLGFIEGLNYAHQEITNAMNADEKAYSQWLESQNISGEWVALSATEDSIPSDVEELLAAKEQEDIDRDDRDWQGLRDNPQWSVGATATRSSVVK